MYRILIILLGCGFIVSSCVEVMNPFAKIPPGDWRAELKLDDQNVLPFNFFVSYDDKDNMSLTVLNADEEIEFDQIDFGRNQKLEDTLMIYLTPYDTYIKAKFKENVMEGHWVVPYRDNYAVPFVAYHGQNHRFSTLRKDVKNDLSGTWSATFEIETEDEYPAIGEFVQKQNGLTGTFRTETGDYRFLEGEVTDSEMMLSCFDGAHAFLFKAEITASGDLIGDFFSGQHYKTNWIARKDDNAKLTDPNDLSKMNRPDKELDFSLPNTEGELVTLSDERYEGRPKLISIMGTWCPNCLDEAKFLKTFVEQNPDSDIDIIMSAFERYRDTARALSTISGYKERLGLPFEMLYGGYYDKKEATVNFGILDEIISYPTLLFVNRSNEVTKVHTGFNGPATSKWQSFKSEFDMEIQNIIQP